MFFVNFFITCLPNVIAVSSIEIAPDEPTEARNKTENATELVNSTS